MDTGAVNCNAIGYCICPKNVEIEISIAGAVDCYTVFRPAIIIIWPENAAVGFLVSTRAGASAVDGHAVCRRTENAGIPSRVGWVCITKGPGTGAVDSHTVCRRTENAGIIGVTIVATEAVDGRAVCRNTENAGCITTMVINDTGAVNRRAIDRSWTENDTIITGSGAVDCCTISSINQ